MKTKDRLAQVLEANGCPPEMVERAASGYYDDYESLLAMPCNALVEDLRALKKFALAKRAMNGEFDGTKEEAEAWMTREGAAALFPLQPKGFKT